MTRTPLALSVDLGIAAHELRTPLAAILAAAELLCDGAGSDSAEVHRFAEMVWRNADRLDGLIEDLVLLAELEQGAQARIRPVAVDQLAEQVAGRKQAALAERGVKLRLSCGTGPFVAGDRRLLFEALGHVVDNAAAATATGGIVRLTARCHDGDWRISVTDDGPAVSKAERDRVFEPFFSAGGRKKGLGLAIAAGVARRHGGRAAARSGSGHGLTVSLRLPGMTDPGPA